MSEYHQLPTSASSQEDIDISYDEAVTTSKGKKRPSLAGLLAFGPRLALVVCIVCTILNLAVSIFLRPGATGPVQSVSHSSLRREDVAKLRRPSQFIGFDQIPRSKPPLPRQFNNYPILVAQIDSAQPKKVFEQDLRRYIARVGTISPEDRRILVTKTVSTLVQFRAIDYGMGICELRLSLPQLPPPDSALLDPSQSRPLSVYRLNSTFPLDTRTLSASSRPKRIGKVADVSVGNLQLSNGDGDANEHVWSRKFSCQEEEVLSFEIACGTDARGGECDIEWWQNREDSGPAIYITQYATV